MRQIDMSAEAVSARLKLVSELRRLCLELSTTMRKLNSNKPLEEVKKEDPPKGTK